MSYTFQPLNTALTGIKASTMGMSVSANNVTNAQTPGYARETVNQTNMPSTQTFTDQYTYMGQGVDAKNAQRISDQYINDQVRKTNSQSSYWSSMNNELSNIQQVFNEPNGTSVRTAMDNFFSSWNQLSQSPNSEATRAAVLESSKSLVDAFSNTNNTLSDDKTRYQSELSNGVQAVNSIAKSIAQINGQIESAQAIGDAPNSLLDQRDALLSKLSGYMKVNVTYGTNPSNSNVETMNISYKTVDASGTVTSHNLVQDGNTNALSTSDVGQFQDKQYGTLNSYQDLSNYTSNVQDQMNSLLTSIASDVNGLQSNSSAYEADGTTNNAPKLFNISGSNVSVNSNITPDELAVSSSPNSQTDGSNALSIAELATSKNYDQTYGGYISQIGDDAQNAQNESTTFDSLSTQAQNMQTSMSGVDINQEMTNMVQYQQTYDASAKYMSVFSNMLNTLIQDS